MYSAPGPSSQPTAPKIEHMKAVTYHDVGDFRVTEVPRPRLGSSRDAVVRVTLGAICGSDLHIYHGHVPIEEGAVIGHEFVGVVEEVGPEIQSLRARSPKTWGARRSAPGPSTHRSRSSGTPRASEPTRSWSVWACSRPSRPPFTACAAAARSPRSAFPAG